MILSINTSTLQFSLALLGMDGDIFGECLLSSSHKHFGGLFPAFLFLLKSSHKDLTALRATAVAIGPGSFTGLRVGLSTAKGLCHGLGIPLIGISALEALANQIPFCPLPISPIIDSRRGEVFTAQFKWDEHEGMNRIMEETCVKFEDLPGVFLEPTVIIGTDFNKQAPILQEVMGARAILAPADRWYIGATAIARLGVQRLNKGETDNLKDISPVYFRPPDIRPNPYPLLKGDDI